MTHNQNTITNHYQQLQSYERGLIMARQSDGWSCQRIARELHRNPSTISRELKRGTVRQIGANHKPFKAYFADTAQMVYNNHRTACHAVSWVLKAPEFFRQLVIELRRKPRVHSVDSFVHWFKMNQPELPCPSTPTVYRYIDDGRLELTNSELPMKLRRRVKSSRNPHNRMNKHVLGQSIEDRPIIASDRTEVGHWEGDFVKGKRVASEPAIMTLTERTSRYEIIVKIANYHAETCRQALQSVIDDYGPEHFKTVTFDNGSEFADLSQVTGTTVYFAHPYSPWERGTNENQNQLIREFIPKGRSMRSLTIVGIQAIQNALNQRPRRILGYQSAMDVLPDFD
ncbi:IS30 family transposase [Lactiplantibacillus paraplantarum]|uniref:Transposase n=1 Tax=Lactiplantibacillus paraplantarum TaxID=60520 RepID=A0ABQ0NBY4_9LACO|nr:IS30 family transposase [Lactiplantibacillus paraplantarum]ERL45821.1 integrase core domain protein [Lactiplantibacillus paraplantarum]MCU4685172.1 IS30 family transposase [Lactiplantibacillus paraplantarum]QJU50850.1 putative 14.4 kDa protein in laf 3'region [Lactiplantibacillus paraplantarum]UKB40345.1 IS30 family transposase [Lactiplantibacillus paraplantarum]GBF02576.1 transposase [Lactiplantibacillus paraplantarum]